MTDPIFAAEPKRVLVVEDDQVFRRLVADVLTRKGHLVSQAENGSVAKSLILENPDEYEVVISDVRMPVMDGNELLKFVKARSRAKFILMTGFSEILETIDAFSLGADEFLAKPFRSDALLKAFARCFGARTVAADSAGEAPDDPTNYCRIPVDEFISASYLISDVYVQLSPSKFVKVASVGDKVPVERLKIYRAKNVEFLCVRRADYAKYVNFALKVSHLASESTHLSNDSKMQVLMKTTKAVVEQLCLDGVDKTTLSAAKQVVDDALRTVADDPRVLNIMSEFASHSDKLYAHSLGVSILSALIAKEHGWSAPSSLFKVILGALFHDIGKREIDPAILNKSRLDLSAEDIKLLESHPARSRQILAELPSLPEEVSIIAFHHHENRTGTGYPQGLKSESIHPVAKLIAVADRFCSLVYPIQEGASPLAPQEAIARIESVHADELDMTFLRRLKNLIGLMEKTESGAA